MKHSCRTGRGEEGSGACEPVSALSAPLSPTLSSCHNFASPPSPPPSKVHFMSSTLFIPLSWFIFSRVSCCHKIFFSFHCTSTGSDKLILILFVCQSVINKDRRGIGLLRICWHILDMPDGGRRSSGISLVMWPPAGGVLDYLRQNDH